jgi:hypothetical protein
VRPNVTLHVNGSPESRAMFEFLENADIDFRAVLSRRAVSIATFGPLRFVGLDGARELAEMLRGLEQAWLSEAEVAMPDLLESPDPQAMQQVEETRARWRSEARAVLSRAIGLGATV